MRILRVRVKPGARETSLEEGAEGLWIARVKAPAVDGKANAALIELIAERFGVRKAAVTLIVGSRARLKLVRVSE